MVAGGKEHLKKKPVGFHQIMFESTNHKVTMFNYLEIEVIFNFISVENISNSKVPNIPVGFTEKLRENRAVVVMDIVASERAHVTELKTLIQSFLIPLKNSNMYQILIIVFVFILIIVLL